MEKLSSSLFIYEKLFREFTVSSVSQISKSVQRTRKVDVNMENGHTNRNYLAYSFSPHFIACILFARRTLRMQEIETTRNQTASSGDTKVALSLNDESNP